MSYFHFNFEYPSIGSSDDEESNYLYNFISPPFFWGISPLDNENPSFDSQGDVGSGEISNNNTDNKTNDTFLKRGKRGRIKKEKSNEKKKTRPEHDKSARDNIKRKIQVHYLKFLLNFLNKILSEIIYKDKKTESFYFYRLKYLFSKDISKNSFEKLKNTSIGDIFKENTSPKFKDPQKSNINVYNEVIKQNDKMINILNQKYLDFFYIYYLKIKQINLSKFGINQTINLSSGLEFYEDLIKKEREKNNYSNYDTYLSKIEKCIKKDFLKNKTISMPIFFVKLKNK